MFFVKVHDRREEEFIFKLPWNRFPGEGQAVRGEEDESLNAVSSQLPGLFCKHHTDAHTDVAHSHVFFPSQVRS